MTTRNHDDISRLNNNSMGTFYKEDLFGHEYVKGNFGGIDYDDVNRERALQEHKLKESAA